MPKSLTLTKTYTPYDRYTDSGVAWLGQVPEGWDSSTIRNTCHVLTGGTPDRTNLEYWNNGTINWLSSGQINKRRIFDVDQKITLEGLANSNATFLPVGSVLIALNGQGKTKGMVATLEIESTCNQSLAAIIPSKILDYKFTYYYLFSRYKDIRGLVGEARDGLNLNHVKSINLPLPPLSTQQRIATYLDEKTETIDTIITRKKRLVELLEEKRKSVISEAVSSEKLKVKSEKLKFLAPLRNQKVAVKKESDTYLALENIKSWRGTLLNASDTQVFESIVNVFKKDDILFGKLRPYLAKVHLAGFDGVCTGELLPLVPQKNKILPKYLFYKTIDEKFIDLVNNSTFGAKMPRASWDFIGNIEIEYPSLDKQAEIVAGLDEQLLKIDAVIKKVKQSIQLLTEYKSSLISHVVTGKVKV